jgi:hypothetical protein
VYLRRSAMVTLAREIEIDAASGADIDVAVARGIARAGAKLGPARYARIRHTHIDVSSRRQTDTTMRLRVTFVLND